MRCASARAKRTREASRADDLVDRRPPGGQNSAPRLCVEEPTERDGTSCSANNEFGQSLSASRRTLEVWGARWNPKDVQFVRPACPICG